MSRPKPAALTFLAVLILAGQPSVAHGQGQAAPAEAAPAGGLSPSIILNGGFEDGGRRGVDGWEHGEQRGASFEWVDDVAHTGKRSVRLALKNAKSAWWYQPVWLEADTDFRLTGWIRTDAVKGEEAATTGARLCIVGRGGAEACTQPLAGTHDWTAVDLTFKSRAMGEVRIVAWLGDKDARTTGRAWFDDIRIDCPNGRPAGVEAYKLGGTAGLKPPRLLREVKPYYTAGAMRAKIQGTVIVEAIVLPDGSVGQTRIIRSLDPEFGLDRSALVTARQWRFMPGTLNGQAVPVIVTIELSFKLK